MSFVGSVGEYLSIYKVFPNRFNPNEMEVDERLKLRTVMKNGEYDPIIVSPACTFYGDEVWKMEISYSHPGKSTSVLEDPRDSYIICDGYHRFMQAWWVGLKEIRCEVWEMTEDKAMPYFYSRHKLRGQLDPIKEAVLFQHEMIKNGLTVPQIVKKYNLSGVSYLHKRLASLKVNVRVVTLFYKPPKKAKGSLFLGHLSALSRVDPAYQYPLAHKCCMEDWSVRKLEEEVTSLKRKRGTFDEALSTRLLEQAEKKRELLKKDDSESLSRDTPLTDEELKAELEEVTGVNVEEEPKTLGEVRGGPPVIPRPDSWSRDEPLTRKSGKRARDYDPLILRFVESGEEKSVVRITNPAEALEDILGKIQNRIIFKDLNKKIRAYRKGTTLYLEKLKTSSTVETPRGVPLYAMPRRRVKRVLTADEVMAFAEMLITRIDETDINELNFDDLLVEARSMIDRARFVVGEKKETILQMALKIVQAYTIKVDK